MADVKVLHKDLEGNPRPPLSDIPGRLRWLAAQIENGLDPAQEPLRTLLWVSYSSTGEISVGAFGECPTNKAQAVGILALAQRLFTHEEGDISREGHVLDDPAPVVPIR